MKLEIKKLTGEEMEFMLEDADPAFANALRRVMAYEVPIMAIDEVEFLKNDSVMYDEIITHRLSLIPLKTPADGYYLPEKCSCSGKGCPSCMVTFKLSKTGPANVLSGDLESSDEGVVPVSREIPIVKLAEGQKLEFTAIARLGVGREHAKWQPGVVSYKYMPVIEINHKACDACEACVSACPQSILLIEDGRLKVVDVERCTLCKACEEACPKGAIKVGHDDTKFIFKVESTGCMPPEQILSKALEVMEEKFREFLKHVKKL
jgi:DNA-directed RNA polymerase subunit D